MSSEENCGVALVWPTSASAAKRVAAFIRCGTKSRCGSDQGRKGGGPGKRRGRDAVAGRLFEQVNDVRPTTVHGRSAGQR